MIDKVAARRAVDAYRQDANSFKGTDQNLGATKEGIDRDPRLRNIRTDGDEADEGTSEKLSKILSHLDSIHTALADANARMDAFEAKKGRADGDNDDEENSEIDYGSPAGDDDNPEGKPTPLVADRNRKDARKDGKMNEEVPIERQDSTRRAAAEFQARADTVFQVFQDSAPRFMQGESLIAYKQRLLSKLKKYSETWAKTDIYRLRQPEALAIAADQIFADADSYGRSPASVPEGVVRCVTEVDRAGRHIQRFYGDPEAVWGMFKQPTRRLVGINKNFGP